LRILNPAATNLDVYSIDGHSQAVSQYVGTDKSSRLFVATFGTPGLMISGPHKGAALGLSSPVLFLSIEHVAIVPGDQVVFDVGSRGKGEIMLYDADSNTLACIAAGRSPLVLLDGATEAISDATP
jgi:hypothetical protein